MSADLRFYIVEDDLKFLIYSPASTFECTNMPSLCGVGDQAWGLKHRQALSQAELYIPVLTPGLLLLMPTELHERLRPSGVLVQPQGMQRSEVKHLRSLILETLCK